MENIFNTHPLEDDEDEELRELRDAISDIDNSDDEERSSSSFQSQTYNPFSSARPAQTTPFISGTPRTSWSPMFGSSAPSPGSSSSYYNNQSGPGSYQQSTWGGNAGSLNRNKRIIFTDLLDCVIESYQPPQQPRGMYDIRIKFPVWDKLACFSPDYIFILSNQRLDSEVAEKYYYVLSQYVSWALADYVRIPVNNCRCLISNGFDRNSKYTKPGTGLIHAALKKYVPDCAKNYKKGDMIVIGAASGGLNQSDRDARMAAKFGCDYLSIEQLLRSC